MPRITRGSRCYGARDWSLPSRGRWRRGCTRRRPRRGWSRRGVGATPSTPGSAPMWARVRWHRPSGRYADRRHVVHAEQQARAERDDARAGRFGGPRCRRASRRWAGRGPRGRAADPPELEFLGAALPDLLVPGADLDRHAPDPAARRRRLGTLQAAPAPAPGRGGEAAIAATATATARWPLTSAARRHSISAAHVAGHHVLRALHDDVVTEHPLEQLQLA